MVLQVYILTLFRGARLFCRYSSDDATGFLTLFRGAQLFVAILRWCYKFLDAIPRGTTFLSLFLERQLFCDVATFLPLFFKWALLF